MITEFAHALWKRQNEIPPEQKPQISVVALIVFLANFLVFLPLLIILNYTFQKVFPVLAIVEDEKPPVYEPIATDVNADPNVNKNNSSTAPFADGRPVTSSFRGTFNLLRSTGGFRALFRGLPCLVAHSVARGIIVSFFLGMPGGTYLSVVGDLVASLLLVQLSTAWVHIVMTPHSPLQFWKRLLPFKYTLIATWRPTVIFWAVTQVIRFLYIPIRMAFVNGSNEEIRESDAWRLLGSLGCLFLLQIVCTVPAYVLLVRVQASLLPEDTETIVPFDRSFNGQIEPAVVGGRGYATLRDAWVSFSKPAWRRVIKLWVKLTLVTVASSMVLGVVIAIQLLTFGALDS